MLVANSGSDDARVVKEAESLAAAGHEVRVLCLSKAHAPAIETRNGVTFERCSEPHRRGFRGRVQPSVGPTAPRARTPRGPRGSVYSRALATLKAAVGPFVQHEINTLTFTRAAARLAPDIIHAHDFEVLSAAVRAARACGARVVYDMHELEEGRLPAPSALARWWKARIERRALAEVAATLTVSPSIARLKAAQHDIPLPAVVLNAPRRAPGGVRQPDLRARCGLDADIPLAVYVGTVAEGRGVETLLEALAGLQDMHLAILGTVRPAMAPVLDRFQRSPAGLRLHLLSPVPHDEVVSHIASADLGVCTIPGTCQNYELCLPNKLFEMTLAGLPLLVSTTTELSRFVAETCTGIAVDATRAESIAAGLAAVYANRKRLRPSPAALADLTRRFSWETQAARLIDLYEAVLRIPAGMPARMARNSLAGRVLPTTALASEL